MNSQTVGVVLAWETGGLCGTEPFRARLRSIDADECHIAGVFQSETRA